MEDIEPTLGKNAKNGTALRMKIFNSFFRGGVSSFGRYRADPRKKMVQLRMKILGTSQDHNEREKIEMRT